MPLKKRQTAGTISTPGMGLKDLFPESISGKVDAVGDWLGTGARIGGGILGAEGGPVGGGINAGAEALAQFLESSLDRKTSAARIGVEAGLGAIPFGKVASLGKAGFAAAKTGLISGGGDVGRQWAEGNFEEGGQGFQPVRTAVATGLGAGAGAIYNKFNGPKVAPKADVVIESSGAVPRSIAPSGLAMGNTPKTDAAKAVNMGGDRASLAAGAKTHSAARSLPKSKNYEPGVSEIRGISPIPRGKAPWASPEFTDEVAGRVPYGVADDEAGLLADLERQFAGAMDAGDRRFATDAINKTKEGLEAGSPTVTESIKGPAATQTTRWAAPAADEAVADDVLDQLNAMAPTPEAAEQIGKALQGTSPRVAQLLTNLTDPKAIEAYNYYRNVAGEGDLAAYKKAFQEQGVRAARITRPVPTSEAVEAAPAPKDVQALSETITPASKGRVVAPGSEQRRNTTHPSFYDEGFEGLDDATEIAQRQQSVHPSFYDDSADALDIAPGKSTITPQASEKLAAHTAQATPEQAKQLAEASAVYNDPNATKAAKRAAGKTLGQLRDMFEGKGKYKPLDPKGEKGFQNIEAMLSTAFGAGGALTGAAIDASDGDDTWIDGAAAGLALGAGAPQAPKALMALKSSVDPNNLEQVKDMATKFVAKLPQVQRFSLLANPQGLEQGMPAIGMNAYAGPYGAVLTTAVESILKEDPRGWQLLKEAWNPVRFMKGAWNSSEEARQALIRGEEGRAGGVSAINPDSTLDKVLSLPGQMMTTGDIYARKLLGQAGFSDEEARVATLTSEPGKAWRGLANVAKNNPLMQLMFPFRRTPVNIMEQGVQRIPGVGFFTGPDRGINEMIAEQGMGALAMGGNYVLASNIEDDTARRNFRRLMSNAGGRYSLPAQIGFTAGDAKARGAKQALNEQSMKQLFPLPATDVLFDAYNKAGNISQNGIDSLGDVIPTSMSMKPMRQFVGDRIPELRQTLGVEPPPSQGLRKRGKRAPRSNNR